MPFNDELRPVLVVADNAMLRKRLQGLLRDADYDVHLVEDAAEALLILEEQLIGLVIVDHALPRFTGLDLLREIHRQLPSMPVILLVGKDELGIAVEAMKEGAVSCITKPVEAPRLLKLANSSLVLHVFETIRIGEMLERIGPYRLLYQIGTGSMGAVYLAVKGQQRFAMKILHHLTDDDERPEELRRRFLREAELCTGLHHPHIVEIVEFGMDERLGRPFIVMELLAGVPLHELARRHPTLDYRDKTRILIQLADALSAIHDRGICHRDLKPSNILVDDHFQVKVTDFGVAYLPGSELTLTSELLGSPAYMAPESFVTPRVDWRADLFSLGIVAYEFYLGKLPFAAESIADTATSITHRKPPEPRSLDANFPPALQLLLGQLLRKDPADRYQSAKAVVDAFQGYLAEDPRSPGWEQRSLADLGRLMLCNDWE